MFSDNEQSTEKKRIFVNLCAEDLYFLTTRAGWKVTKIYEHYTFKQDTFKKDFAVMNQNARKIAKTKAEKDFHKLLNNSNFGNDCRNNIGNCKLDLLYDGLDEISYIKKFTNIFNYDCFSNFFSEELLREQVTSEYDKILQDLDKDDPFYFSMHENITQKYEEDLEAIEQFIRKKKKRKFNNSLVIESIEKKKKLKIVKIFEKIK